MNKHLQIAVSLLLLWTSGSAQKHGDFLGTTFVTSPDGRKTIAMDFYQGEMSYMGNARLHNLPLGSSEFIELPTDHFYEWSYNGAYIFTNDLRGFSEQSSPCRILMYTDQGELTRVIPNGMSLNTVFSVYKSEYDAEDNWIAPRLVTYDMENEQHEEIFVFGDSLSFFGEQADWICAPEPIEYWAGGYMTLLFTRGDFKPYTFVVNKDKGILFMKAGNHMSWGDNPQYPLPADGFR